jgi:hypothetical protein
MRKHTFLMTCLSVVVVAFFLVGCAGMETKPTEGNFAKPQVTLSHVEVPQYFGYWFYSNKVEPTKGKAGNNGSPLLLAFIFEIQNPNAFPVMMSDLQFTTNLDGFDLNTVGSAETMWIPAGKTNQLRVYAVYDVAPARGNLLLAGGMILKEKGIDPWDELEKLWVQAPDFSYPIKVKEGSAVFKADGVVKAVPFEATFP